MPDAFQRYWHASSEEPRFLLDFHEPEAGLRHRASIIGAIVYHIAVILFVLNAPSGAVRSGDATQFLIDFRKATPLVAPRDVPPFKLTQKEQQRNKPAAEVDIAALMPRPAIQQPRQTPPGQPAAPPPPAPAAAPKPQAPVIEAPKIETAQQGVPTTAGVLAPRIPTTPPPPDAQTAAKSPFERVGVPQPASSITNRPALTPPKATVDEAVRAAQRSGPGRGVVVGDTGAGGMGGISEGVTQTPSPGRSASTLELLSDPQGADLRPYMIQVLSAVKRNWQAVIPESARFGRQGRVAIQFSIDKSGRVPKLVIAVPSGAEALDRAAVAGISASNPFPPPPAEFKGNEIRLQLMFSYNMPR